MQSRIDLVKGKWDAISQSREVNFEWGWVDSTGKVEWQHFTPLKQMCWNQSSSLKWHTPKLAFILPIYPTVFRWHSFLIRFSHSNEWRPGWNGMIITQETQLCWAKHWMQFYHFCLTIAPKSSNELCSALSELWKVYRNYCNAKEPNQKWSLSFLLYIFYSSNADLSFYYSPFYYFL